MQTDASNNGLGAVLSQKLDDKEVAIAYASRTLNDAEQKYAVTEKECLAVVWGIRKMRPYLEGYHFTVITDHQALKWLHSLENPSGRLARWALELQQYDFKIQYRKGSLNVLADALSRQPMKQEGKLCSIYLNDIKCNWYTTKWKQIQTQPENFPDYRITDNQLYRHIYDPTVYTEDPNMAWKLCVPKDSRDQILRKNHDDVTAGHLGVTKTIARISKHYYWPGMFRDIAKYVRSCQSCLKFKPMQQKPAGKMHCTPTDKPWEIVSSDFIGPLPRSTKGNTMILVFQDKYTKWTEFLALREATSTALIRGFKERVLSRFGCPKVLITDNGSQYTSKTFQRFIHDLNITQRFTPPYTPQANPTERVNRVIKTMIAQYIDKDQRKWDENLPELMLALNTSQHESTGYNPAFLNFGRNLRLPHTPNEYTEAADTPNERFQKLKEIFNLVNINMSRAFNRQSHQYNLRRRQWKPKPNDHVLLRNRVLSSATNNFSAKLAPKYDGPYIVHKIISPVVVQLRKYNDKNLSTAHVKDLKPMPDMHYTSSKKVPLSQANPTIGCTQSKIAHCKNAAKSVHFVTNNRSDQMNPTGRTTISIGYQADPTKRKQTQPTVITSKGRRAAKAVNPEPIRTPTKRIQILKISHLPTLTPVQLREIFRRTVPTPTTTSVPTVITPSRPTSAARKLTPGTQRFTSSRMKTLVKEMHTSGGTSKPKTTAQRPINNETPLPSVDPFAGINIRPNPEGRRKLFRVTGPLGPVHVTQKANGTAILRFKGQVKEIPAEHQNADQRSN